MPESRSPAVRSRCSAFMPVVVGRALDRIQPVHPLVRFFAPLGIVPHQLVKARIRRARKKVRIQRNNHIRVAQVVLNIQHRLANAVPAIAGSYCTSFALGYAFCTAFHCRASVGEVMVALRK